MILEVSIIEDVVEPPVGGRVSAHAVAAHALKRLGEDRANDHPSFNRRERSVLSRARRDDIQVPQVTLSQRLGIVEFIQHALYLLLCHVEEVDIALVAHKLAEEAALAEFGQGALPALLALRLVLEHFLLLRLCALPGILEMRQQLMIRLALDVPEIDLRGAIQTFLLKEEVAHALDEEGMAPGQPENPGRFLFGEGEAGPVRRHLHQFARLLLAQWLKHEGTENVEEWRAAYPTVTDFVERSNGGRDIGDLPYSGLCAQEAEEVQVKLLIAGYIVEGVHEQDRVQSLLLGGIQHTAERILAVSIGGKREC